MKAKKWKNCNFLFHRRKLVSQQISQITPLLWSHFIHLTHFFSPSSFSPLRGKVCSKIIMEMRVGYIISINHCCTTTTTKLIYMSLSSSSSSCVTWRGNFLVLWRKSWLTRERMSEEGFVLCGFVRFLADLLCLLVCEGSNVRGKKVWEMCDI